MTMVILIRYDGAMRTITVTQFKAQCLSLIESVRTGGEAIMVTKQGQPAVMISPVGDRPTVKRNRLGGLAGKVRIVGDITEPVVAPEEWEVLR